MSVSMRDVVTARTLIAAAEADHGLLNSEARTELLANASNWTQAYIRDLLAYIGPRKVSTGKF